MADVSEKVGEPSVIGGCLPANNCGPARVTCVGWIRPKKPELHGVCKPASDAQLESPRPPVLALGGRSWPGAAAGMGRAPLPPGLPPMPFREALPGSGLGSTSCDTGSPVQRAVALSPAAGSMLEREGYGRALGHCAVPLPPSCSAVPVGASRTKAGVRDRKWTECRAAAPWA